MFKGQTESLGYTRSASTKPSPFKISVFVNWADQRATRLIRFAHPRLNRLRKKSKSFVLRRSAPKTGATRLFRYAHVYLHPNTRKPKTARAEDPGQARDSQATRWTLISSRLRPPQSRGGREEVICYQSS